VAARSVLRESYQGLILALVTVYDPCQPRPVPLGPEAGLPAGDWARLEDHLRDAATLGGFSRERGPVKEVHNEAIVPGRVPFGYQSFDEPRLHELRRRYRLDEVVAGAKDEWDAFVRLRNWTRSRFRRHDYQPFRNHFDALEVLDRNLRNPDGEP